MPPIRLSTVQARTLPTLSATLAQLSTIAHAASKRGVHLLLFPEAYLGGYPRGKSFDALVGSRTSEGRDEFWEYARGCVDLGDVSHEGAGGEYVVGGGDGTREVLEGTARETGVFLVVGIVERVGGTLYCGVVYVCPREGLVGKRRKLMPTGTERVIWGFGSSATLKAIHTKLNNVPVVLAAAICWENYMPLLRYQLYSQHVQIYLAPTADGRESWISTMRHIAMEGRCYVLGSNQYVEEEVKGDRTGCEGGSCIVDPMGNLVGSVGNAEGVGYEPLTKSNALWGREGYIDIEIADLGKDIGKAKMDMDVVGHYKGPWKVVEASGAIEGVGKK
ncbi:carbon-nitrogen hydrolase [Peziza echinospora]|nr:carbon-nitrogen hydrolase [Peziza echinospora]